MKSEPVIQSVILLIILCFISGCADRMPYSFKGVVARYPHSNIVDSMRLKGGCYAELETNDSGEKILDFYKDHLRKSGWSIKVEREPVSFNTGNLKSATFLALFKDNTGLMIDTYTPAYGGKTLIALFMGNTGE